MRRSQNTLIEVTANDLKKIGWLGKKETIQTVSTNEDGGITITASVVEKATQRAPRRAYKKYKKRKQSAASKTVAGKARTEVKTGVKKSAEPAPKPARKNLAKVNKGEQ